MDSKIIINLKIKLKIKTELKINSASMFVVSEKKKHAGTLKR